MKPNLLMLHGALGSKKQLIPLKERITPYFNVYDLNFEGHGGSNAENAFSIALFAENTIHFLDENNLRSIDVFGYSMGGYVALKVALMRPDLIGQIVTLGTKFDWSEESAANEVKMLNPEKIEEKVPKFAEKLRQEHHPEDWKQVMIKTAQMMLAMGNGARLEPADFEAIPNEVTLGIGSLDKMVSLNETAEIAQLISNSTLVELPDVPHPIEMVNKEQLEKYVLHAFGKQVDLTDK